MTTRNYILILLVLGLSTCKAPQTILSYTSDNLKVEQLTPNTYRHISYLPTEEWGNVACNGMIVVDGGEALVFDTPTNDADSKELIEWIQDTLKCDVIGIVVTHFHEDCLGGLKEFHDQQIPSFASSKTIALAQSAGEEVPRMGFESSRELNVGNKKVVNEFFGEGHTRDNIVCYFPSEKVLFGGCLIKRLGAGKGFVGDANVDEWSNTVRAVKSKFGGAKVIIPGHGKPGNRKLLDYTIELFDTESQP